MRRSAHTRIWPPVFGRTGWAPFLAAPEVHVVDLAGGFGAAGYARRGRWAVTAGDVVAPEPLADRALSQYLHILDQRRLKAAFVAISDPAPFRRRGFAVSEIADEAILDLKNFGLSGKAPANLRHAVASARRAGLTVNPTSRGRTSRSVRCPPRGSALNGAASSASPCPAMTMSPGSWPRASPICGWCSMGRLHRPGLVHLAALPSTATRACWTSCAADPPRPQPHHGLPHLHELGALPILGRHLGKPRQRAARAQLCPPSASTLLVVCGPSNKSSIRAGSLGDLPHSGGVAATVRAGRDLWCLLPGRHASCPPPQQLTVGDQSADVAS